MKFEEFDLGSPQCLSYLERYLNNGSPTGFTRQFTTSPETSPFGNTVNFPLANTQVPASFLNFEIGRRPLSLSSYGFLLHPDMATNNFWNELSEPSGPIVTPTASGRTVRVVGQDPIYIKLGYNLQIGRVNRQIDVQNAIYSIDTSKVIIAAINKNLIPNYFGFMPEIYSQVISNPSIDGKNISWGYIIRDSQPYPNRNENSVLVPAFSLYSYDRNSQHDPLLLDQFVKLSGRSPWDFVINGLINPLISAYFTLIEVSGLLLEAHSQNILFSFDLNGNPIAVIARDAESIYRDFPLVDLFNIPHINDFNYKSLLSTDFDYQMMHSFLFDFKLGEYLLEPLSSWLDTKTGCGKEKIYKAIRDISGPFIKNMPINFLPINKWYSCENTIQIRSNRTYIENSNPKFR